MTADYAVSLDTMFLACSTGDMPDDYNTIGQWLLPKIYERQWSIEQFARKCGLSRAIVYFYIHDTNRPTTQTMAKMCNVLGVPLEDGLRQYTPKKRVGRLIRRSL